MDVGPTNSAAQWVPGGGVAKWSKCEVNHLRASSASVKMCGGIPSLPKHTFMACKVATLHLLAGSYSDIKIT